MYLVSKYWNLWTELIQISKDYCMSINIQCTLVIIDYCWFIFYVINRLFFFFFRGAVLFPQAVEMFSLYSMLDSTWYCHFIFFSHFNNCLNVLQYDFNMHVLNNMILSYFSFAYLTFIYLPSECVSYDFRFIFLFSLLGYWIF